MTLPLVANTAHEPYAALIESAETWLGEGHYKEAVILAQTAVELFTEKVLGHLYHTRHIEYLKPDFERLLINYNIGNSKVSSLYMTLSGDPLTQQSFWRAITDHVELRNKLVHDGQDATEAQARASLAAIKNLIAHVAGHTGLA
jgi:hypothetical protein